VRSQDPANGGLAEPIAQPHQLAMHPARAPAGILPAEPKHHLAHLVADRRTASSVRISPLSRYQTTMPSQQRARRDDPRHPHMSRQESRQRGQHRPIRPVQPRPTNLPTQHRDLMTQDQQLSDHRGITARKYSQPPEQPNRNQIHEPKTHGR